MCAQLPSTLADQLTGSAKTVQGETLQMRATMAKFYRQRGYQISWTESGCFLPRVDRLITALERASLEGLNPDNYHLAQIRKSRRTWFTSHGAISDPQRIIDFDLLCTDAYLLYASHLLAGLTDLDRVKAQWALLRRKADLTQVLDRALQNNDIEGSLLALCPPQNGYANLKLALALYRKKNADPEQIHKIKFNMSVGATVTTRGDGIMVREMVLYGNPVDPTTSKFGGVEIIVKSDGPLIETASVFSGVANVCMS
jgi:murein L,D-transpeptidase YcbB/YkuD